MPAGENDPYFNELFYINANGSPEPEINQAWGSYNLTAKGIDTLRTQYTQVQTEIPYLPSDLLTSGYWRIILSVRTNPYTFTTIAISLLDGIITDMTGIEKTRSDNPIPVPLNKWSKDDRDEFTQNFRMADIFVIIDRNQQRLALEGPKDDEHLILEAKISGLQLLNQEGAMVAELIL